MKNHRKNHRTNHRINHTTINGNHRTTERINHRNENEEHHKTHSTGKNNTKNVDNNDHRRQTIGAENTSERKQKTVRFNPYITVNILDNNDNLTETRQTELTENHRRHLPTTTNGTPDN